MNPRTPRIGRDWLAAAALAALAFAAFVPALRCGFVNYDDPLYVTGNPYVTGGLTAAGVTRAFTAYDAGNWHPLTWLSLQLDATLWKSADGGPNPLGFHLTSVLIHAASAAVLFLALRALTGAFWRSAVVALWFGVHPLRVESVAWVAERKDVLSVFFGLLALWAYAAYARRPTVWRYLLVAAPFALSLLAKPMLVTLPCLLLVLDWWPLQRAAAPRTDRAPKSAGLQSDANPSAATNWPRLVLEKLPLFALAAASSVLTFQAQSAGGAIIQLETLSPGARVAAAVLGYGTYLAQTLWPGDLGCYYPYPTGTAGGADVAGVGVLLLALTGAAVALRKRAPYLLAGWLWYLGTLVPVIGLLQVGLQSHADRYTYWPQVGILLAACWGGADLARRWPRAALAVAAAVAAAWAVVTWVQVSVWTDAVALWQHDLAAAGPSAFGRYQLGSAFQERNDLARAADNYRKAVELRPDYFQALLSLANAQQKRGNLKDAVHYFQACCDLQPGNADAHRYLARALLQQGNLKDADMHFQEAIRLDPQMVDAYCGRGRVHALANDLPGAVALYEQALKLDENSALAHCELGVARFQQGNVPGAVAELNASIRCDPRAATPHFFLGKVLEARDLDGAAGHFAAAVELEPASEINRKTLAAALDGLVRAGKRERALQIQRQLAARLPAAAAPGASPSPPGRGE